MVRTLAGGLALLACACSQPEPEATAADSAESPLPQIDESVGRAYQRGFAFFSGDSIVVGWVSDARTQPGGVVRRHRGWLYRDDTWEAFVDAQWESPPTRVPWRIVPHGPVRLVVSDEGGLEQLSFQDPPRSLGLRLGEPLAEWAGPRGQVVRVLEARTSLPDREVDGTVADLTRNWQSEESEPGDWAFLVSGDSLQMVLEESTAAGPYRAWVRYASRDLQWPNVAVEWVETQAFEPARRDVPSRWTVASSDGSLNAEFTAVSSELEPGAGEGPLLPVDGLFRVEGEVALEGRTLAIYGLVRHRQN